MRNIIALIENGKIFFNSRGKQNSCMDVLGSVSVSFAPPSFSNATPRLELRTVTGSRWKDHCTTEMVVKVTLEPWTISRVLQLHVRSKRVEEPDYEHWVVLHCTPCRANYAWRSINLHQQPFKKVSLKKAAAAKQAKGRVRLPKRMNFRNSSKGEGRGSFSIQKIMLQVLDLYIQGVPEKRLL